MRIHVRFTLEGFHCWPAAPKHRAYLAQTHRHLFWFELSCDVHHGDREIEFHDLQDAGQETVKELQGPDGNFGSMSCEMIARGVGERLAVRFNRGFSVTVWEDGECGATVETGRPRASDARPST